jgi:hypothetical protein
MQFVLITHAPEFESEADVVYNLTRSPDGTIATRVV